MTLHAVLTLNLCLESYGAAVHLMDAMMGSGVYLGSQRPVSTASVEPLLKAESFDDSVRTATDALPIDQAHALWLVDVCGCSYDQAAVEAGATRDLIAHRIDDGRRSIRAGLAAGDVSVAVR